jgi:hypothetical protein
MKIIHYVGICALGGMVAFGCSSASSPGGSEFNNNGNAENPIQGASDDGGGTSNTGSSSGATSSSGAGASSGGPGTGTASSSGGSATNSSGGGTASSSGGSTNGGNDAGGIVSTDGAPVDDPEIDYSQTQTVTMSTFTVDPGAEVFYCQTFADPWTAQVDIKTYDLSMSAGSHHMFAFYQAGATTASSATPCPNGGLTFGAFTFTSQTPHVVQTYPATIGATIPSGTGFNMMAHYLNTTSQTLNAVVSLTRYVAKPNVVTNHAGVIFLNNLAIDIPSTNQPVITTDSYSLTQDVNILTASSHMHKFATNFVATTSTGVTLYSTTTWDNPTPTIFSPPLQLSTGTSITWTCTDVNDTGATLTFGESAQTNAMCIDVNIFYPVQDVTNPVLGAGLSGFGAL